MNLDKSLATEKAQVVLSKRKEKESIGRMSIPGIYLSNNPIPV